MDAIYTCVDAVGPARPQIQQSSCVGTPGTITEMHINKTHELPGYRVVLLCILFRTCVLVIYALMNGVAKAIITPNNGTNATRWHVLYMWTVPTQKNVPTHCILSGRNCARYLIADTFCAGGRQPLLCADDISI